MNASTVNGENFVSLDGTPVGNEPAAPPAPRRRVDPRRKGHLLARDMVGTLPSANRHSYPSFPSDDLALGFTHPPSQIFQSPSSPSTTEINSQSDGPGIPSEDQAYSFSSVGENHYWVPEKDFSRDKRAWIRWGACSLEPRAHLTKPGHNTDVHRRYHITPYSNPSSVIDHG